MNAQTKYKLEPLEIVGPNAIGAYTIMHAQHGTHRATTYDPGFARLIAAAPELFESLLDLVAMADFVAQRESGMDELKARIADARAAIAKAVTP